MSGPFDPLITDWTPHGDNRVIVGTSGRGRAREVLFHELLTNEEQTVLRTRCRCI